MRRDWAVSVFLIVATLAVYGQVVNHGFVNFDDRLYVTQNLAVQQGLTWEGLVWAFTSTEATNWHPLTWLSHMLDCQVFGGHAGLHHLVSVLLHGANSVLLYFVLKRMTSAPWPSAVVAAFFALHPMHVESVAWVSERKDVLSTLFGMLTLLAYVRYVEAPSWKRYWPVPALLALGLMAKPMLVTLPLVLLLLDWWPLKRFRPAAEAAPSEGAAAGPPLPWEKYARGSRNLALVLEKAPLLALSALSGAVTFLVQQQGGAMTGVEILPLDVRAAVAMVAYLAYVMKMLWPTHLSCFYPYPPAAPILQGIGAGLVVVAITVLAIRARHSRPHLSVGWLWYVVTLVPVIGLVQVGTQSMADRYSYIPFIGLFMAVVWDVRDMAAEWRHRRILLPAAAGAAILGCMAVTWVQVGTWRNTETLCRHAIAVTTDNYVAHNNLGVALMLQGKTEEATAHYVESLRIAPWYIPAHQNMGGILWKQGKMDEAIDHYKTILQVNPKFVMAYNGWAEALWGQGKTAEAMERYQEAVRINPKYAEGYYSLGTALARQGKTDEAIARWREALRINPAHVRAHTRLGAALAKQGDTAAAIAHLAQALRTAPDDLEAHEALAGVMAAVGRWDIAVGHWQVVVKAGPDQAGPRVRLGTALMRLGRLDRATTEIRRAILLDPKLADAHSALGDVLSLADRAAEAIAAYQEAIRLRPDDVDIHYHLACILNVAEKRQEAAAECREALRLGPDRVDIANYLAWLLATCDDAKARNGAEAVTLAEKVCAKTGRQDPSALDTLAAAYAEAGRFPDAVKTAEEAIVKAKALGARAVVDELQKHLELYKAGRPYREPKPPPPKSDSGKGP